MREQVERLQPGTLDPAMKLDLQTGIRVCLETFYKASGQSWLKTEEAMQAAFKTDVSYICVCTCIRVYKYLCMCKRISVYLYSILSS